MSRIHLKTVCVLIYVAQFQVEGMDRSRAVPSSRKYVAEGYAIRSVPADMDYDHPECSLIESNVRSTFDDYAAVTEKGTFDITTALTKFSACKNAICSRDSIVHKLQTKSPLMQELSSVAITFGKTFDPAYKVFKMLTDPTFDRILSKLGDDEFPVVRRTSFARQRNAVYDIIKTVCEYQPPSIKAEMTPQFVTVTFIYTMVPIYVQRIFAGGVINKIMSNLYNESALENWWNEAAKQRITDHPCLDPRLEEHDNHATIEELQVHAQTLHGVNCQTGDGSSDYEYAEYAAYAPPPSDTGPEEDAPPSFDGPSSNGPPSGGPSNSFAP